ncbi:hypothetical protein, partial [Chromatium okenii]|uniref:hypothetical protein n=1 Tax=Chromatium okenii TaxID=61644 RepID=UPI0026EFFEF6
ADNFLAGSLGIGTSTSSDVKVNIGGTFPASGGGCYPVRLIGTANNTTTGSIMYHARLSTSSGGATVGSIQYYLADQGTFSGAVTYQTGFTADGTLTGAVNNYGFYGGIASGTGRYNLYMAGTADNFLAGSLGIGTSTSSDVKVNIGGTFPASGGGCYPVRLIGTANNTTTGSIMYHARLSTSSGGATVGSIQYYLADQGTFSGAVTYQTGFTADGTLTGAVNNYGFYGGIASGTGRYNLYMAGTADNFLAGSLGIGTTTPSASAILDAQSTTKGIRFPNMTTTQKNAVSSPAAGLVVFDTTLSKLCVYTGAAWQTITSV